MGKMQDIQDQYCLALTDEAIEKMRADGHDVESLYKSIEAAKQRRDEKMRNVVHLERLDADKKTPRDPKSAFVKKAVKGNKNVIAEAPLVYGAVVQAQNTLWEPFKNYNCGTVIVFTLDERYRYDTAYLTEMAGKISASKKDDTNADTKALRDNLLNTRSVFCNKVGQSIAGDVDVWCCTYFIKDTKLLPKMFIPNDRILPFLVMSELKEGNKVFTQGSPIELINKDFYE